MQALRSVLAAALTNFAMGLLYCWTLYSSPIGSFLGASDVAIGGVPALSLLAFTVGVNLYTVLSGRLPPRGIIALVFMTAAIGVGLFAAMPSIVTIYLGYGLLFGTASGIGYVMALGFVRRVPAPYDNLSLGICMTSFALTAIAITLPVQLSIDTAGVQGTFALLAAGLCLVGTIVFWIARTDDPAAAPQPRARHDPVRPVAYYATAAAFFACCFAGLGIMANSRMILEAFGVPASTALASAAVFNLAYISGSMFGAAVAGLLGGRSTIVGMLAFLALAIVLAMVANSPFAGWTLTAVAACILGATASVFPVHIAQTFGQQSVIVLFARLLIFYGLAGSISPWILTSIKSWTGDLAGFLLAALCISLASAVAVVMTINRGAGMARR